MKGFSEPDRSDCMSKRGGLMLFITEDIPSKLLSIEKKLNRSFLCRC